MKFIVYMGVVMALCLAGCDSDSQTVKTKPKPNKEVLEPVKAEADFYRSGFYLVLAGSVFSYLAGVAVGSKSVKDHE